jgi:hypothetical protein
VGTVQEVHVLGQLLEQGNGDLPQAAAAGDGPGRDHPHLVGRHLDVGGRKVHHQAVLRLGVGQFVRPLGDVQGQIARVQPALAAVLFEP